MEEEEQNGDCSSEESEEEILVYVNFEEPIEHFSKEDLVSSEMLGLDTDEPILQIGNKVFGGSWNETVGTALFFEKGKPVEKRCYFSETVDKPLQFSCKTSKSLNLKRIFISERITPIVVDEVNNAADGDNCDV